GYLIGDVVACSDVDGDGHLDLVATRSECDSPSIYVESFGIVGWYGSEDDWSPTPGAPDFELSYDLGICDPSWSRWWREFSVGDIDGDGASEILVAMYPQKNSGAFPGTKECGVWVIPGGTYSGSGDLEDEVCDRYECEDLGWLQNPWVVDLYGDGINEVAIGNQFYSEGNGLVGLLSDPDPDECVTADMGALFHTSIVGTEGEYLGFSVAFGEIDLNDGTDAVISAYLNSTGEHYGGALYFFSDVGSLGETGLHASEVADAVVLGDVEECYFPGYNVVTVGDLDGDGYGEVLAGEAYLGSRPSVERSFHLLSGAALANASEPLTPLEADILAWETAATHLMGEEMVSGDFDGDGYGDIAIAQPDYPTGGYPEQGKVYIYLTGDYGL
ncbi:MAG: FG-GAP repeat protein, partial [Deltaproteobacteria bacterium]|nr:FG-GAP repeat protein [Deltaproteobacteria bacterium]